MKIKYRYLITVWGDVEPSYRGPFKTDEERDTEAKNFRKEEGDAHGIYGLDIGASGKIEVWSYSGGFFEEGDAADAVNVSEGN